MNSPAHKKLFLAAGVLLVVLMAARVALEVAFPGSVPPLGLMGREEGSVASMPAPMPAGAPGYAGEMMAYDEYAGSDAAFSSKAMMIAPPMAGGTTAAEADQKLIKTGSLDLRVASVPEAAAQLTTLAQGKGGFVQDSSVSEREDGTHFGYVTVRVPAAQFEAMVGEAKALATQVRNEALNGQDVTEQYTDLQARLKNARAQEASYLEILKRAIDIEDVLAVQRELGNIRGQIESMEGSLKYLENATSYSTLSVSLSEEPAVRLPSKEFRPLASAREAAQALITLGQGLAIFAIWFVIIGAGIALPLLLVLYAAYRLVKRWIATKARR